MKFKTLGNRNAPAVLFFHAMGVTGESSEPVANYLQDRYFCILPTSTVYCKGQKYVSKADEIRQVEAYLKSQGVERLELVVASSIGADLAMAFLTGTKLPIGHVFFDGGQFAQIGKGTRRMMTPFLYLAIKSLYWSKGGTLKKIMWCDDDAIKPKLFTQGEYMCIHGPCAAGKVNSPYFAQQPFAAHCAVFELDKLDQKIEFQRLQRHGFAAFCYGALFRFGVDDEIVPVAIITEITALFCLSVILPHDLIASCVEELTKANRAKAQIHRSIQNGVLLAQMVHILLLLCFRNNPFTW